MAKYMNIGQTEMTFRGVTIKPGEVKELKGFANDLRLIRVTESGASSVKEKKKAEEPKPQQPASSVPTSETEKQNQSEKQSQPEPKKDNKQNAKS